MVSDTINFDSASNGNQCGFTSSVSAFTAAMPFTKTNQNSRVTLITVDLTD